ncbi:uncharacterized protein LOC132602779 [Lycium barbarum]|uniref:uncharacterized protein LOC132602779 n=1 Tax=Lycium barbarum TaxID=112863 RepID=UPI00293EAEC8|nr:uncharacterized protein LOC132602779 [Lycium barbarum]
MGCDSYHKAWRSLQHACNVIRGIPENNYTLLPQYLHMMKLRNPGTVANIKWTADNKFKYVFFTYGASIEGWKHCRPVMMMDATFLKSKCRGVLMIAVEKDGNNSIFPLAFGIVDSENNESYRWFFRHVKKVFGTRKDLSIIFDRHSSITTAIKELYPDTQHGICIYHMEKNLQKYFPSEAILSLFYNATTTYKQAEFRTYMSQIQQIDPKAAEYIEEEPPKRWARSFHTNRRYNMLTTNNVETMNFVLRKAREFPIMACIDYIQNKLQNWFYQRKLDATGSSHDLTCWAKKILLEKISRGFTMKVSFPVNLVNGRVMLAYVPGNNLLDNYVSTLICFCFDLLVQRVLFLTAILLFMAALLVDSLLWRNLICITASCWLIGSEYGVHRLCLSLDLLP